ncbi:hypothetical protein B0H34DRAFT_93241 [Crassisporium funariophilum]|nr:hypothetical protein B0H34DRAFT_93241 [Crassisporium funariophilum]
MLLKLIPPLGEPTIHFSFAFPDLPPHLPHPPAYTAQLHHLLIEDLEVPTTVHSLDKAAGVTSLLEEVCLDMQDERVRCRFVDGLEEEWGMREGEGLVGRLEGIVRDVRESTVEDERERERVMEAQRERDRVRLQMRFSVPPPSALPSAKGARHKKQRSLFMQIVSSIVNLTSPSSSSHHPSLSLPSHAPTPPPSPTHQTTFHHPSSPIHSSHPPPPPATTTTPPGSSPRARALRRAARSALVDTYRLYVLHELVRRSQFAEGGFAVWICRSMGRRAGERMEWLVEEAKRGQQSLERLYPVSPSPPLLTQEEQEEGEKFSATTMVVPLSFSDDGRSSTSSSHSAHSSSAHSSGPADRPAPSLIETEEDRDDTQTETETDNDLSAHKHARAARPRPVTQMSTSTVASTASSESSSSSSNGSSSSSSGCTTSTASTAATSVSSTPTTTTPPSPPTKSTPLPTSDPSPPVPPTKDTPSLTPEAHYEHTHLRHLRERLHLLLIFAASHARIAADEQRGRMEVLGVRGRRRAWLNGRWAAGCAGPSGIISKSNDGNGGTGGNGGAGYGGGWGGYGMAAPFRSSPLGRYVFCAADVVHTPSASEEEDEAFVNATDADDADEFADIEMYDELHARPLALGIAHGRGRRPHPHPRRRGSRRKPGIGMGLVGMPSGGCLFPVSEEDELSMHSHSHEMGLYDPSQDSDEDEFDEEDEGGEEESLLSEEQFGGGYGYDCLLDGEEGDGEEGEGEDGEEEGEGDELDLELGFGGDVYAHRQFQHPPLPSYTPTHSLGSGSALSPSLSIASPTSPTFSAPTRTSSSSNEDEDTTRLAFEMERVERPARQDHERTEHKRKDDERADDLPRRRRRWGGRRVHARDGPSR